MKRLSYLSITIISLVTHVMPLPTNVLQVHYQILNINPLATQIEVAEGKEKMLTAIAKELADKTDISIFKKKIEEAHAILSDPVQRKNYDESLQPLLFTTATFEHFERAGILYHHEQCILYESLNISSDASSDEIHEACAHLLDQSSLQDDTTQERTLKKVAATEALLTHPIIKKNYRTYITNQLHRFSEKLANARTSLVPWKSYYEIFNLSQETDNSEIQKAFQREIAQVNAQLKKIKECTAPSILALRNKRQLLESIKKLLTSQQERYLYDLFLTTLSKALSEENGYYKLLKVYDDADQGSIDAAYKKLYNEGINSLADLKGDEQSKQRYIIAFQSTVYNILSDKTARANYDNGQKKRVQEKTRSQGRTLSTSPIQKATQAPLISNNRVVLKKGGGHQQRLSPLQVRRTRALSKRPGQHYGLYKPHAAKTGEEIEVIKPSPVRRQVLKKRPGQPKTLLPKKEEKQATLPHTKAPQKPLLPMPSNTIKKASLQHMN